MYWNPPPSLMRVLIESARPASYGTTSAQIAYSTWQALRRVGSSVGMRLSRMFTRIQATPSATSRVSTWRGDEEHECCPSS
jgi:hypothetical protein